jgi:hypothetical protein
MATRRLTAEVGETMTASFPHRVDETYATAATAQTRYLG